MRRQSGFTLVELMIAIAIAALLAAFAIPNFMDWLPKYRLRSAVDELFSDLQNAKMEAIRSGSACGISFAAGSYTVSCTGKTVTLADFESGVTFARPDAGGAYPASISFNTRGLSTTSSYAYLTNDPKSAYFRVGALTSGVVRIQKWNGSTWN